MKTPLRYQISEYDCGTTSFLNALSFLYEREEIPAELVKSIEKYTLDVSDNEGDVGEGGTSSTALVKLSKLLNDYKNPHNNFSISCKHLLKDQIKIDLFEKCINNRGCILIKSWLKTGHYVIITKIKRNKVYVFDPYYLPDRYYDESKNIKNIISRPFEYNRIVRIQRLESRSKLDLSLGPIDERECILIERK